MDPVRIASRLTAAGVLCAAVVFGLIGSATVVATAVETNDATHFDFFESQVRTLLVNRCYECHSGIAVWNQADLRLDSRDAILKGGKSGPAIILGKPNESRLIEYVQHRGKIKMPKGRPKLSDSEIVSLVKWVELGAPWPKIEPKLSGDEYDWEKARQHWAFQPIRKQEGSVDQFISNGLKTAGLKSPPQAQSSIFVRRAFLDLIGLPPTPAELQRWSDRLDDEFDQTTVLELVNDLLSRPQYGERWGRHWLDVARYSDAGGWTQDNRPTPSAWQYRDWVVRAFNKDLPYNDFVRHQIYGDYIDSDAAIGTGFFALGPSYMSDGGAPEGLAQAKAETLDDRVDTFSRGFLGLTLSCARCHDHKFDAIPIVDYYSIAGIFSNSGEGERPLARGEEIKAYHDYFKPIYELHRRIGKHREDAATENRPVSQEEQSQIDAWEKEAKKLESEAPPKYAFAHTLHDRSSEDMHVALRGNLLKRGPLAPRRFLRVLSHLETGDGYSEGSGRRSLAESVVSPNNPLTARVLVNRLWLHHFGKALVRTPGQFRSSRRTSHSPCSVGLARGQVHRIGLVDQGHAPVDHDFRSLPSQQRLRSRGLRKGCRQPFDLAHEPAPNGGRVMAGFIVSRHRRTRDNHRRAPCRRHREEQPSNAVCQGQSQRPTGIRCVPPPVRFSHPTRQQRQAHGRRHAAAVPLHAEQSFHARTRKGTRAPTGTRCRTR